MSDQKQASPIQNLLNWFAPKKQLVAWSMLNNEGQAIFEDMKREWKKLISQRSADRTAYTSFLSNNAALFFRQTTSLVISGLALGSENSVDLVAVVDAYTSGVEYHLFHINRPQVALYSSSGALSADLTQAIKTIRGWKAWIDANQKAAKTLFPSWSWDQHGRATFVYWLIIGENTHTNPGFLKDYHADDMSIHIRTFDYLTERLEHPIEDSISVAASDWKDKPLIDRVMVSNPFFKAVPSKRWMELVRHGFTPGHLLSSNIDLLLKHLVPNERYQAFQSKWTSLDEKTQKEYQERLKNA